jgi:L-arabinokinase
MIFQLFVMCIFTESGSCQVSYGSELGNRGPTFDMDLSDFMDGDKPISYKKAREYFAKDPAQKSVTQMHHFIYI